ncbi:BOS complex subunit NOMO1 [Topomyia yanbarensis]|uniref:BOS complex subunit NOMO1 n=1 Tax=Topomyia yanbarensis TaxID=2498891 RepID=UPI00273B8AD6|nr:BOS complex subunit NOMO1 [Topomyia yanbarensis]
MGRPCLTVVCLLYFTLVVSKLCTANEVFGCGGFIKNANSDLDFSKVEVGLYNLQGSLKIKTDCSPSNGYYFIPLYDKGQYVLKVIPPPGWSFEPEQVAIKFDGTTDICSQGKDVNFLFKGFGITGMVEIYRHSVGAKGVQVELRSESNTKIGQTITDSNGIFSFTPIKSGKYVIRVKHDKWYFVQPEYGVTVTTGNTEIPPKSLVVAGFQVDGSVVSDGQPFGNVGFLLYAEKGAVSMVKCPTENIPRVNGTDPKYGGSPRCYVEANKATGKFSFPSVSTGKYRVVPHFTSKDIQFHIRPEAMEFEIGRDSVDLSESFEVTGFSVSGNVLLGSEGPGVANAKVKLNGREIATTGSDGKYMLANIQAGTYTIQVTADDLQFKDHIVKIALSKPALPDIIVDGFKVCGQVISQQSHRVSISRKTPTFQVEIPTKANAGGEWCTYLESGQYTVRVVTSEQEHAAGIQFFPLTQTISVDRSPLGGIMFSQLRATVEGEIRCLADAAGSSCPKDLTVTLTALDSNASPVGQPTKADSEAGRYSFSNVLPGSYEVAVPKSRLCWQASTIRINVKTAEENVPTFVQSGYVVSIVSSHSTKMIYKKEGVENAKSQEIALNPGLNTFCVDTAGSYAISFVGCHKFDDNVARSFSTLDSTPLTITAVKHRNTVKILAEEKYSYTTKVSIGSSIQTIEFTPTGEMLNNRHVYKHDFFLESGENIHLTPLSDIMLFSPVWLDATGGSDCTEVPTKIIASKGLLINGRTAPPIKDANITLLFPKNMELTPLVTITNDNGEFRFGPIDASLTVELSAEKESYVFSAFDKSSNTFSGHKLCEIIVTVRDDTGGKLPGVLLSLSGAESYRKNLVTGEDGTIKFHSLSPSEYYLRAMMKEYDFKPNSKLIEVKEGATVTEELKATRTAFSIFGSITSLNGEPFPNVPVEAVTDERCGNHLEEGTSEFNGQYRIRGLQPGCQYRVRVRTNGPNSNVDRSIPKEKSTTVEKGDIRDVNMIAISPLTFVDVTVRVLASENDFYKTLKIFLYKTGSDSPVHSQRIESPLNPKSKINPGIMVFFPRIPFDGKSYYIELTTSLSEKNYKYNLPTVQFTANSSSYFTELHFRPELRTAENDLNQNSLSAIVLIFIVGFIFFKQDLALELLGMVWNKVAAGVGEIVSRSKPKEQKYEPGAIDEKEIEKLASSINAIKKKKVKKAN